MRIKVLFSILALALVIFLLQHIALAEFLYWKWWWFDNLMHFLGGILIGGIAFVASDVLKTPRALTFIVALLGIGIGWEIFELGFGLYDGAWDVVDTSTDLLMDTLGALMVYSGIKLWE